MVDSFLGATCRHCGPKKAEINLLAIKIPAFALRAILLGKMI